MPVLSTRRRFLFITVVLCISGAIAAAIVLQTAPQTTAVDVQACLKQGQSCLQLPSVTGNNLNNEPLTFPAAFAGDINLVVMPFDREQQVRTLEYVPLFQALAQDYPGLAYYSMAALPDLAAPIRLLVTGGMNAAVIDPTIRAVTVILYLEDQTSFIRGLNVPDTEAIQVFIFNRAGEVLHQQSGDFSDAAAERLKTALEKRHE